MSKIGITICLAISAVFHCWLIWGNCPLDKISEQENKQEKPVIKAADVQVVAVPQPKPQSAQPQKPAQKETPAESQPKPAKAQEAKETEMQTEQHPLPLEKTLAAKPKTEMEVKGSFTGDPDGEEMPFLRISWGSAQNAGNILAKSNMKLVIIEADKSISKEIAALGGEKWQIVSFQLPQDIKYSQCIRNVSKVPAFKDVAEALKLKPDQYIAIMIPTELEQHIEQVKNAAASSNGLTLEQIKAFGGQFNLIGDKVEFEITLIKTRT